MNGPGKKPSDEKRAPKGPPSLDDQETLAPGLHATSAITPPPEDSRVPPTAAPIGDETALVSSTDLPTVGFAGGEAKTAAPGEVLFDETSAETPQPASIGFEEPAAEASAATVIAGGGVGAGGKPDFPERIGHYRIIRRIGAGGMGEVYEAEQEKPVKRRVALKLIQIGMATQSIIARFEAERQALAMMSHPCIARVYDAGTTENGLPYFAMEYIEGSTLTEYCDSARMTTQQRLKLFIDICEGVQHAHQRGIIHRDLKPSNVLVKIEGEKPCPKIIDFGIAKPLSARLTESTYVTAAGQPIGTPEYMSPEQAGMGDADVDTRTDVYSLGVMLYELLVGAKPFDAKELKLRTLDELWKHIREDDAPRASTRISTSASAVAASKAAVARRTNALQLARELRGDLDWILMKALEKDRNRRYSSASEFAADVQRHLDDEPVLAGPPSKRYRFKKFVTRNKLAVSAAAMVLLAMAVGITGTTVGLIRAVRAERLAVSEATRANQQAKVSEETVRFLVGLFSVVDPSEARGNSVTAREILDRGSARIAKELADQPKVQATLMSSMGTVYRSLGLYTAAKPLYEQAIALGRSVSKGADASLADALNNYATLLMKLGDIEPAERSYREALAMRRELFGEDDPAVAESLNDLAILLGQKGDNQAATPLYQQALEMRKRLLGQENAQVAATMHNLGMNLFDLGNTDTPLPYLRASLAMRRKLFGDVHPDVSESLNSLAYVLYARGEYEQAEPLFREALSVQKQLVGEVHPDVALAMNNLAFILHDHGDLDAAEAIYREALDVQRKLLGENHPDTARVMSNLAAVLHDKGAIADAEELARKALGINRSVYGSEHPEVAQALNNLARWMQEKGDFVEAEAMYREALAMRRKLLGEKHPHTAMTMTGLANLLVETGRFDEARALATEGRAILAGALTETHWRVAVADGVIGGALAGQRKFEEAEPLLIKGYDIAGREKAAAMYKADARRRLIALYEAWNKPEDAAKYRSAAAEGATGDK